MKDAQAAMAQYANGDRMEPPPFRVGNRVYVLTDHIRTNRTTRKLAEKKLSLFPIISQPSAASFTLRLPSMIQIHPVFHVAQLEPEHPNAFDDHEQPPPPPLTVDGAPEYLIERTLDYKYNRVRRKCQLLYHIKWVDYLVSNNSSDWILANAFVAVHANVVSTDIDAVTNAKGRRLHAVSVRVLGHGGLGILHTITQELVVLVEVDGEVTRS